VDPSQSVVCAWQCEHPGCGIRFAHHFQPIRGIPPVGLFVELPGDQPVMKGPVGILRSSGALDFQGAICPVLLPSVSLSLCACPAPSAG